MSHNKTPIRLGGGIGLTPRGEPVGGHGFHHLGRLHLAGNRGRPPAPALGPHVSLGPQPLRGWENCWEVWSTGKRSILKMEGRASVSPDRCPGNL